MDYPIEEVDKNHLVLKKQGAILIQGIDLFEETLKLRKILPTNCRNLDQLLEGGLFTQEITEVFGPPGVGKTQFGLSITSYVTYSMNANVYYFDTSGSFSPERLVEIIQSNTDLFSQQAIRVVLSRVNCYTIFNVFDFFAKLESLKERLLLEYDEFCLNLKLIVVDSLNSVISPVLGGKNQHGHVMMLRIAQLLKEISFEFGISVLVLNSAVAHYDANKLTSDELKPSLGKSWISVPQIRLFFDFSNKDRLQRLLEIWKHPRLSTKGSAIIYVRKNGISSE